MENNPYAEQSNEVVEYWKNVLENPPKDTSKEALEWAKQDLALVNEALESRQSK